MTQISIYSNNLTEKDLVKDFLANKKSDLTRKFYRTDINIFLRYAGANNLRELLNFDYYILVNILIKYRNSLIVFDSNKLPTNLNTVARKMYSLKSLFKFLYKMRIIDTNPMDAVDNVETVQESKSNALSVSELKCLFDYIDCNTLVGKRDKAIILLMYHCALRRNNIATLKISDIGYDEDIATIRFIAKRNKYMLLPLKPEVLKAIKEYLSATNRNEKSYTNDYIFLSHSNNQNETKSHISTQTIYNLVKKYISKAKIQKRISPHSFRRSSVTHALDNGATYREVQNLTGHSDARLVSRYDLGSRLTNNATWKLPALCG